MANYQNSSALEGLTLGKSTEYSNKYDPTLLQGVPRSLNRDNLSLTTENLPFYGEDVWYGYELSWLNTKGKPVVAVAEFRVPCTSDNIVESKSFKLYLNSFNQSQFVSQQQVEEALIKDLSKTANAPVVVSLFAVDKCPALSITPITATCIDEEDIEVLSYDYDPSLLASDVPSDAKVEEHLVSHLLKSNCLITNQPDWASVYIKYSGKAINHAKLLSYLVSFREHNEFHEQCVERIYCDIKKFCDVSSLEVFARYTRRGGLDINPFRSSEPMSAPNARTLRQ
ncbi:NADPH-dependent 7-cyano-7-deazaguanine reductase QueF [Thalassotalea atypica]|uniref:NADPH-dependent 7-cyano-7-deazaguanine reductase QueF n=1 Tax=Thalassotalea atypica TaxID=2054316 RepID=UPI0025747E15|nr:NADPH-dependent 7-cyano-7-deazaguanine reductase QueF [Thalassotalea atypica]